MINFTSSINNIYSKNKSYNKTAQKIDNYKNIPLQINKEFEKTNNNSAKTNQIIQYNLYEQKVVIDEPQQTFLKNPDLFFIRMYSYSKNRIWAQNMLNTANNCTQMIKDKKSFDDLFEYLTTSLKKINKDPNYGQWRPLKNGGNYHLYNYNRGKEYFKIYKSLPYTDNLEEENTLKYKPKSNSQYERANTCSIIDTGSTIDILYGCCSSNKNINSNLSLVKDEYNKLINMDYPTDEDINKSCAIIQWLISQESPFLRGNDSFANLLTKSIYAAYDMDITPVIESHSLDFEAFYHDLDDYIKIYPYMFEKYPSKK